MASLDSEPITKDVARIERWLQSKSPSGKWEVEDWDHTFAVALRYSRMKFGTLHHAKAAIGMFITNMADEPWDESLELFPYCGFHTAIDVIAFAVTEAEREFDLAGGRDTDDG